MDPFILEGEKGKVKVKVNPGADYVTVIYHFWIPTHRTSINFPITGISFGEGRTITMTIPEYIPEVFTCPEEETYGQFLSFVASFLQEKVGQDKDKKRCMQFLREVCEITPEDEERFKIWENIRLYTEKDHSFKSGGITYDPPVGWYRLKMTVDDEEEADHWNYGYHGTKAQFVASIMRNRLVVPGNKTADGTLIQIQPGHIPGMNQIYTSPSLHYAAHYVYALDTEFHYREEEDSEEKTYYVRTVFQIRQKPGSFKIQGNTLADFCWDSSVRMDDTFTNDELEWFTEDPSTIIPLGLLLYFSEVPSSVLYKKREEEQRIKYSDDIQTTFMDSRALVQDNFKKEKKKKILWVDDYPPNNEELVEMITERGVEVDQCLDTTSAIRKVLTEGPDAYCIAITDMRRREKREGDDEPMEYREAGLDFILIAKGQGWKFPIYLYSSYARRWQNIMHAAKEAGAEKICTYEDIKYIIEENVDVGEGES